MYTLRAGGLRDGILNQAPDIAPGVIEKMKSLERYAGNIAARGTPYANRNAKVQVY